MRTLQHSHNRLTDDRVFISRICSGADGVDRRTVLVGDRKKVLSGLLEKEMARVVDVDVLRNRICGRSERKNVIRVDNVCDNILVVWSVTGPWKQLNGLWGQMDARPLP